MNLARLSAAGNDLAVVKAEFESAAASSKGLSEAVGHGRLAEALVDFAEKWDDRREDMTKDIGALSESATGIAQAFGQLDTEYAAALGGDA